MPEMQYFLEALDGQQTVRRQMESLANNLRSLPDIANPQMPDLAPHISAVKTHAYDYLSGLSEEMNHFYDETINYGEELEKAANHALAVLKSGRSEASTDVIELFRPVLDSGNSIEASLNQLCKDIGAFDDKINADARNLLSDQQKAQQLLAGDEARLYSLNMRIESLKRELESKRRTEIIAGIFTLGIAAAIMELTNYMESTERDISEARRQTAIVHQQDDQLFATCSALTAFINGTAVLSGLAMNLEKGWQTVIADLKEITDHKIPENFMEATINSILADWKQVAKAVEGLRN